VDDGGTPKKSHLAVGWTKIGTKTFFFNDENALLTGVQNISGKQYLLGEDGSRKKGWQDYDGEKYYLTRDGVITTGLQKIDGKKYFFFDDGPMAASEWVAGKWYNAKGALTSKRGAWQKDAAGRMYVDNSGRKTTAKWATVDREDYYFDALGYVVKGAKPVGESAVAPTKVKCKINYVTKKKIMNRVNQIRKEAYKLGLIKKYTPVKWSYDMEEIAFLRAAESSFEFGHTRPNGESCFSVEASSGASSHWEVIAGGSNPIGGINMWYGEKDAYIREFNGEKNVGVTGHYGYLINCQYIGIASFGVTCGEGGSATKNAKRYATKKRNTATVELRPDNSELRFEVKTSGEEVTELDLCAGQTLYLQAKLSGMTAIGKWYSLDKSVVKISSTGKLKGMKEGTATIVFRDGPFSKALTIRVHPAVNKLKWKQTSQGKRLGDSKGWYLKKQWVRIKGKYYYFKEDGYMASDEWIDGYYISAGGKSTRKLKGKWVYTKKGTKYKTSKGRYLKNATVKIDGAVYTFNALGYISWNWW
jgi:glucan-binding YG repeat protein